MPTSQIQCDCSWKHTGMLATCVYLGWPLASYLEPEHPLQRQIRAIMEEVLRLEEDRILLAADGCSVPISGAPMLAFATAYATLADPEAAPSGHGREYAEALLRLREAIIAHAWNIAGKGELDTDLMDVRSSGSWPSRALRGCSAWPFRIEAWALPSEITTARSGRVVWWPLPRRISLASRSQTRRPLFGSDRIQRCRTSTPGA